jgi:hypothetical protein
VRWCQRIAAKLLDFKKQLKPEGQGNTERLQAEYKLFHTRYRSEHFLRSRTLSGPI